MQKHSHKFLKMSVALIAASTLLAVGSPIQAAPVNAQVKVTSHLDTNEKPEQSSDWAKAKKYRHDIPVQLLGINDLHGGLEVMLGSAIVNMPTPAAQFAWLLI